MRYPLQKYLGFKSEPLVQGSDPLLCLLNLIAYKGDKFSSLVLTRYLKPQQLGN